MRRTFLLLVCALALFSVKQTCGQIVRGRVVDQERQPVVGVAVVMLDTDSTYLAAAASDADGRFAIASEVRPYRLLFRSTTKPARSSCMNIRMRSTPWS